MLGRVDHELSARRWRERPRPLWPVAEAALRELLAEYELVLIEGAGSPAETNLRSTDLANMRTAHAAGAPVVLVADIDRGGAFAHLLRHLVAGRRRTIARLLRAFVLNKFRGDESLLAPAPRDLEERTGMTFVGVAALGRARAPRRGRCGHARAAPRRARGSRSSATRPRPTSTS